MRLRMQLGVLLIGLALLLSACATSPTRGVTAITVELGEFYFKPARLELPAGQTVTLQLINKGQVEHEFMVGREVEQHEHEGKMEGFSQDFFAGMEVTYTVEKGKVEREEEHGFEVELEPGGKATLTFTVPSDRKGEWEIGCFVPGHYEAGMKGVLIVR
ncbi:Auracyanin-A [Candidatus Thermoflexus japonica]|uniref:Auracyanin-A n=1 Tax=Candidatus Thermoflexus japonica TaxID=2035417 RepID=A0A2H5Y306_9CHLR|nr:Auracyanin-A [Candidatus Thermoflexus japonica]